MFAFAEYVISKSFYISKLVVLGLVTNYILVKFILKNYKVVLKISYIIKFVKTILLDCLIGLIPLILVFKLTFEILSYICTILGLLVFIGLLIFCKEDIIEEFKKVFNF